jgi:hypothetical protein
MTLALGSLLSKCGAEVCEFTTERGVVFAITPGAVESIDPESGRYLPWWDEAKALSARGIE